jgi:hypothetical protein
MKRTIYLLLLPILWGACKKDSKPSYTFKGVVLRRADLSPVSGVKVGVSVITQTTGTPYPTTSGSFNTTTNSKGEYKMEVDGIDPALVNEYYTASSQKGMVQLRSTFKRTKDQVPDTILLDDASYIKMEITVKATPGTQEQLYLNWDFLKPTDNAVVGGGFYRSKDLLVSFPNTKIAIVDSFSHAERPRLLAEFILINTATGATYKPGKDMPLQKQDTNYIKMEY